MTDIPKLEDLFLPTVQALQLLDGSGTIDEIYEKVVQILNLPDEVIAVPHGDTGRTEVEYRLAWSRTYLKKSDFLEGVWEGSSGSQPCQHQIDHGQVNHRLAALGRRLVILGEPPVVV